MKLYERLKGRWLARRPQKPTYFNKAIPEFKQQDAWETMRNMVHRLELIEEKLHGLKISVGGHTEQIKTILTRISEMAAVHVASSDLIDKHAEKIEKILKRLRSIGRSKPAKRKGSKLSRGRRRPDLP